jgi:hypothetical protein
MGSRSPISQHFDALRDAFDKVWASLEQDEAYRPANVLAERDRLAEIIIDLAQVQRLPSSDVPQISEPGLTQISAAISSNPYGFSRASNRCAKRGSGARSNG